MRLVHVGGRIHGVRKVRGIIMNFLIIGIHLKGIRSVHIRSLSTLGACPQASIKTGQIVEADNNCHKEVLRRLVAAT